MNLDCEYRQGTSREGQPRPEIRIFDKTSNRPLLYIRYSSTSSQPPKIWNTVEMKELLKDLTTLRYEKSTTTASSNTAATSQPTPITDKNVNNLKSTEIGTASGLV
jgi:hypothetical protein